MSLIVQVAVIFSLRTNIYLKDEQKSYICTETGVLECLFFPENITDCEYTLFKNEFSDNFQLYNHKRLIGSADRNEIFLTLCKK